MSDNASSGATGGFSLATVFVIVFTILKLTGHISWSWFWVFSPWIFSAALVVLFIIGLVILSMVD